MNKAEWANLALLDGLVITFIEKHIVLKEEQKQP